MSGAAAFGRNHGHVYTTERPTTTFDDIAGYEGVKQEIGEIVDYLGPRAVRRRRRPGPKGVLMVGPPGTGKTLFARAIAGEAGVPFLSVTGSRFVEMFVGVGAAGCVTCSKTARKTRRASCSSMRSTHRRRPRPRPRGGNDEREQTLNQLLAEMDGFDATSGVVVLAATNRPDTLDPALLRPGRFDRQVVIPLPNPRAGGDPGGALPDKHWARTSTSTRSPGDARLLRCRPGQPRQRGGASAVRGGVAPYWPSRPRARRATAC